MKFHIDGTLPKDNEIFVFGSNLSGIHGAGAALVAKNLYRAKLGFGVGLQGGSYAIPTKDHHIITLSLKDIIPHIKEFCNFVDEHRIYNPDIGFFITRIGCGLAGYDDSDIAPLFKMCNAKNCSFANEWKPYLDYKEEM